MLKNTAAADDDLLISRFLTGHTAVMLLIDPATGKILDGNRQAERFYGLRLSELQALSIDDINAHPPEQVAQQRLQAAAKERNFFVFPHRTRNQGVRSVAVYSAPVDLPSGKTALLSIIHDITGHLIPEEDALAYREELERLIDSTSLAMIEQQERRIRLQLWLEAGLLLLIIASAAGLWIRQRALRALQQKSFEARKLQLAVDQSSSSIVITDLDGTIEYVNRACIDNTGYSREELIGHTPRVLRSGKTPKETYVDLWATIKSGKSWQGRLVNRRKNGSEYVERVLINPVLDDQDQPLRFIAIKEDITEREQLAERLQSLERFDALTGLANRAAFFDVLEERLLQIKPNQTRQPLALINIDRFHGFNALHGHAAGDRLLQRVARCLVSKAPKDTVIARLGPDEFALLPPLERIVDVRSANHHELNWIQHVQRGLREGSSNDGDLHQAGASIGIAFCDHRGKADQPCRPGDFMRMADSALHTAKAKGGGQIAFFDAQASVQAQQVLRLEQDLTEAIARDEMYLALQAQVRPDGSLVGAEALLRWRHGTLGDISPGRFIPLAEDSGQIVKIGRWVLEQALEVLASMQAFDPRLTLSVNISPVQVRRAEFVDEVRRLLEASAVVPSGLILEITESVFMDDPVTARAQLQALRDLGVGISIDDFGTGYSSLTYLKRLPVSELKIDQSFVAGLPDDEADTALVSIILSAAQQLGLRVVAEGVETAAQAQYFDSLPNVVLQGYLFDQPSISTEWMAKWGRAAGVHLP